MNVLVFARFHAAPGQEEAMAAVLRERVPVTRATPGCLFIHVGRSQRDPARFFLHSRWTDADAHRAYVALPLTDAFVARMEALSDEPLDVERCDPVASA